MTKTTVKSLPIYQATRLVQDINSDAWAVLVSGDWINVGTGKNGKESKTFKPEENTIARGAFEDWSGAWLRVDGDGQVEFKLGGTHCEQLTLLALMTNMTRKAAEGKTAAEYIGWHTSQKSGAMRRHWADFSKLERMSNAYSDKANPIGTTEVWRATNASELEDYGVTVESGAATEESALKNIGDSINAEIGALAVAGQDFSELATLKGELKVKKVTSKLSAEDLFTNELIAGGKFTKPVASI